MKRIRNHFFIFIFLIVTNVFGQDKEVYGPNNGLLKSAGSFHIEIVPDELNDTYKVFLLDLYNKNSMVQNSSVELQFKESNKMTRFYCSPMGVVHFHCASKKITIKSRQKKGQFIINAERLGIEGQKVIYELPLKLKDNKE